MPRCLLPRGSRPRLSVNCIKIAIEEVAEQLKLKLQTCTSPVIHDIANYERLRQETRQQALKIANGPFIRYAVPFQRKTTKSVVVMGVGTAHAVIVLDNALRNLKGFELTPIFLAPARQLYHCFSTENRVHEISRRSIHITDNMDHLVPRMACLDCPFRVCA